MLRRDSYIDDIVTGTYTKLEAIAVQTEAANCLEILIGIPAEHCLVSDSHSWEHESRAMLELQWHPVDNKFAFTI